MSNEQLLTCAANISSCVAVLTRKLPEHLSNVWTTLSAWGALTQSAVWHHGNRSLQHYFKHAHSVTLFLQRTLPDTNRVSVCVSLLSSCAHSSSDLKSWLLTCPSPYGRPQPPRPHVVCENKPCEWAHFTASSWFLYFAQKINQFQQLTSGVDASSGKRSLEGRDLRSLLLLHFLDGLGFRRSCNRHIVGLRSGKQVLSILEQTENGMMWRGERENKQKVSIFPKNHVNHSVICYLHLIEKRL